MGENGGGGGGGERERGVKGQWAEVKGFLLQNTLGKGWPA